MKEKKILYQKTSTIFTNEIKIFAEFFGTLMFTFVIACSDGNQYVPLSLFCSLIIVGSKNFNNKINKLKIYFRHKWWSSKSSCYININDTWQYINWIWIIIYDCINIWSIFWKLYFSANYK